MPDFSHEYSQAPLRAAGIDEAGRGPWAGPVVAACVYIPRKQEAWLTEVQDSKQISAHKREMLYAQICKHCAVGIGQVGAQEIDRTNIWQATARAMQLAVADCPEACEYLLVDGNRLPDFSLPARALIKGDSISTSIAAASIVAKVTRDRIMHALAETYPHYGFERHAGYGTALHKQALERYGATPEHRHSFAPIKAIAKAGS